MTALKVTPTVNLAPSSDSGVVGDNITKSAKPTFSGTAAAGTNVQVRIDGKLVGTVLVNAKGLWNFTPSASLLDGKHTVTATSVNASGATSAPSNYTVTIDTSSPKPTLQLASGSDSGAVGDGITNATKPTFTGSAAAGSKVTVLIDGKSAGTAVANAAGQWSFTSASLANGKHSVTATATDVAGNNSASANLALRHDSSCRSKSISIAAGCE
jgi:hypothetical protein